MSRWAVGIDLGTTNSTLGATPLSAGDPVETLEVPQVVHAGEVGARSLLPSFLYLPGPEVAAGAVALPWDPARDWVVGAFAREQGAAVPGRLVSSAKSWLSHAGVDRRGAILPWRGGEEVPRLSPLEASARTLQHLREAWAEAHPDAPLAEQALVLTVPASFDAVARELTVEAATRAGLGDGFTLLEEPQAALYAWLAAQGDGWRRQVEVGDRILVCDIGGGTTDFSLIAVEEDQGSLSLRRVAVGDHILLGGDNMDLALAYRVKAELETRGTRLDDWQLGALTHGCRVAKEALFADPALEHHPLVIPGRGASLIGGSVRTELTRSLLDATLLEGFFPQVPVDARPEVPRRVGLTALGLPYASDPGITRHLAAFLTRQAGAAGEAAAEGHGFLHPTAVLFNGGVSKAGPLQARLLEVLDGWLAAEGGAPVKVLSGIDPDLAVGRGAAFYARSRAEGGLRIRGGTARAYYVGIERAELAVPGVPPRLDAVCVAPFGLEEGSEVSLPAPLGLVVGETASFRFFASSERREDTVGAVVDPSILEELPPIETALEGEPGEVVPVNLHARVTEIGTLELSAVHEETARRWKLSFNVRMA